MFISARGHLQRNLGSRLTKLTVRYFSGLRIACGHGTRGGDTRKTNLSFGPGTSRSCFVHAEARSSIRTAGRISCWSVTCVYRSKSVSFQNMSVELAAAGKPRKLHGGFSAAARTTSFAAVIISITAIMAITNATFCRPSLATHQNQTSKIHAHTRLSSFACWRRKKTVCWWKRSTPDWLKGHTAAIRHNRVQHRPLLLSFFSIEATRTES